MGEGFVKRIFGIKFLLCINAYLIIFFKLLLSKGLSRNEILSGIAFGTSVMILGDGVSSLAVDRWGPKRPIILAGVVQAISLGVLAYAKNYSDLILFELLMGVSFPVIYGADSKWLRFHGQGASGIERANQMAFWSAQFASAVVGVLAQNFGVWVCLGNGFLFLMGSLFASVTPDVVPSRTVREKFLPIELHRVLSLLRFGALMGASSLPYWYAQSQIPIWSGSSISTFSVFQVVLAVLPLIGCIWNPKPKHAVVIFSFAVVVFLVSSWANYPVGIFVSLVVAIITRGAISVFSRTTPLASARADAPIATWNFLLNGTAKMVQSVFIYLLIR